MKFFHISDLHIGLKLLNRDFREDQEYILEQIVKRQRKKAGRCGDRGRYL